MNRTTKLYYESHVTIDPVFDDRRSLAETVAASHQFRLAKLILRKESSDPGKDHVDDTFMTGHSVNCVDITNRTSLLVKRLISEGFVVSRYKIEETVFDSRNEDELGLLS